MKKPGFAMLLMLALASPAIAGQIYVGSYGTYQSGHGGEFTYQVVGTPSWLDLSHYAASTRGSASFQSFCVETNEYLYTNTVYDAALTDSAVNGGSGTSTHPDPVSRGTGWLYSQFATGTLAGYSFTGTVAERRASADLLQRTIWWLEDESSSYVGDLTGNVFYNAVVAKFGAVEAKRGSAAEYGVKALNLTNSSRCSGGLCQDALFYVPDGGATLALLGGALMGLGLLRQKLRR